MPHGLTSTTFSWDCPFKLVTTKLHTVQYVQYIFRVHIYFKESVFKPISDKNNFFRQILLRLSAKLPFGYFIIPLFCFQNIDPKAKY
jgi:hypothetical protein